MLNGASVIYGNALSLLDNLEYDISAEKQFSYRDLTMPEIIRHLSRFVACLWQNHIFGEGNTPTTTVFFIQYLRTLGFAAENEPFAENSWYFRNALVRANYNDQQQGVYETTEYLELFLRNLLMGEKNELHNRDMHISGMHKTGRKDDSDPSSVFPFEAELKEGGVSAKTGAHIRQLFSALGYERVFGRTEIMQELGLSAAAASNLIKKMRDIGAVSSVTGAGKGKMRFSLKAAK